jgi:hypothetical protein
MKISVAIRYLLWMTMLSATIAAWINSYMVRLPRAEAVQVLQHSDKGEYLFCYNRVVSSAAFLM